MQQRFSENLRHVGHSAGSSGLTTWGRAHFSRPAARESFMTC
jgi:hypothetical protein